MAPAVPRGRLCRFLWALLLVSLLLCGGERRVAQATCLLLAELANQGAYGVADASGRMIDACNPDRPMVPASVLKIATVSAALALLGPDYRFRTEFHTDRQGNLFIKGFGDPTLVSEEIAALVDTLRRKGLQRVQTLFIDTTAFALTSQVPGQADSDNPYDAPVGPLSVNFNAVPILKEAGGRIRSGEPQTPSLPLMLELGRTLSAGQHRVNICAQGCNAEARMAQYAGELFRAQLQQAGVDVAVLGGILPLPSEGTTLLHTHHSTHALLEISRSILHYSNNFMANLVFLTCGAHRSGYPATWRKAEQAVHQELARQLGQASAAAIVQVEGAGLARDNRVTARSMLELLARFRPHGDLLNRESGAAVKTGTLTGVSNLAGYLPDGQAFVILLNQPTSIRKGVFERLKRQFAFSATRPSQ